MPTSRRSSGGRGAVSTGKQSKLSFGNRVTKPVPKSVKDSVALSPLKKELVQEEVAKDEEIENIEPDEQPQQQEATGVETTKSDAELKAAEISDAAVQKYWRKLEAERIAKRVHQEDLTLSETVLRYFDVCSQYGVSCALPDHRGRRLGRSSLC